MKNILILLCVTFFQFQSSNAQSQFELEGVVVPRTLNINVFTLS